MTRVTYGRASSPYHSIKPLKALADSCTNSNFRHAIINDMFLNDLLRGASDEEYDTHFQDEIIETLKTACFNIRKYTSSLLSLVERLPSCSCKTSHEIITNSNIYPVKTLGKKLSPIPEHFFSQFAWSKSFPTQRENIIGITKLFDPLGWLSATKIQLNSFLQILWRDNLTWDEAVF